MRDKVKVFYNSIEAASQDNYKDFDRRLDVTRGGIVYPFTGIRGDAKELYRLIQQGKEERVKIIRVADLKDQMNYLKAAKIVIIATGYETN